MPYELFERTSVRVGTPSVSLVPDGRMVFNAAAARILRAAGVKAVTLLWDEANSKMALKAAPRGDRNSYAVSVGKSYSGALRAMSFLSHIGWRPSKRTTLPAPWNEKEKMFEVTLPRGSGRK